MLGPLEVRDGDDRVVDLRRKQQRALLGALLTYKRLQANESYLRALADRLIDGFIGQGRCNAASDYAHAAATYAISDLMGIPEGDRAELVLEHCPFAAAAEADPDLVCQLHRGMAEGLAEQIEGVVADGIVVRQPRAAGCRVQLTVGPRRR